jgi:hypothetical protein
VETWDSDFGIRRGIGMVREIGRWVLAPFRLAAVIIVFLRL